MSLNNLNNNNTFLFILIVLLIIILFNTSINCIKKEKEPFIFKKVKKIYNKGKDSIFKSKNDDNNIDELAIINFKIKDAPQDLKENDIVEFYYNSKVLMFRFVVVSSEIDNVDTSYVKINVRDTVSGRDAKISQLSGLYDNNTKILYKFSVIKKGVQNQNFILSKNISINRKLNNDYTDINSPCYILFGSEDEFDNKDHIENISAGDKIKLHSVGDIQPADNMTTATVDSIKISNNNNNHRILFLSNSNLCNLVRRSNLNSNFKEDVLLEIIKPINNEPFSNPAIRKLSKPINRVNLPPTTHNFINLYGVLESSSHKFYNQDLDKLSKIMEFTFLIHKNYIKDKLKNNDIIYFQKNVDDADKILYLIIHEIKTNSDKSDYFEITIKDKYKVIKDKFQKMDQLVKDFKHIRTFDNKNANDIRVVKVGTNYENFILSRNVLLMQNNIIKDNVPTKIYEGLNTNYFIQFASDDLKENLKNIKPFKINDSLKIHKIGDDHPEKEDNLLVENIFKDDNNNQIIILNINSNIENLNVDLNKEVLIEINNFENKISDFIKNPMEDYVSLRYNQFKIDSLKNKLIRLKNELNYENNL